MDKARLKAKPLKVQWTVPNVDGRIPFPLMEAPDFSGASMRNFSISLEPAFLMFRVISRHDRVPHHSASGR